jgi:hypothetical protein
MKNSKIEDHAVYPKAKYNYLFLREEFHFVLFYNRK